MENRGYASLERRRKGYPLSSFNRMLYLGLCFLISAHSNSSASNSVEVMMVSKSQIWDTIFTVLGVWDARLAKYWLTRFFSAFALPM